MAKIAFTKLGLKRDESIKEIEWNGQKLEIKQFLPTLEKLDLISRIISFSTDEHTFYNPCKVEIFETIEVILAYVNINLTDKQGEDILKLYDLFTSSGFAEIIKNNIPDKELNYIHKGVFDTITEIYHYRDSALGIMQAIVEDYKDVEFQGKELLEDLGNQEKLPLIKDVVTKLG